MTNQKIIRPLFSLYRNSHQEISGQKKVVTHYISGSEPNDYSQVLNPAGYDDSRYRKNPIVLFQHGLGGVFSSSPAKQQLDFVIGKNTYLIHEDGCLKAETYFRDDSNSEFADDIYNLYCLGFLNGWSKWFYPISEPRQEGGLIYYDRWGIYEYSSVFIPVDSDATTKEVNYINALDSVKSDSMKKLFIHELISGKISENDQGSKILDEISQIKREFELIRNDDKSSELSKITDEKIEQYHKLIMPNIEDFARSIKKINDFRENLETIVEESVINAVKKISG